MTFKQVQGDVTDDRQVFGCIIETNARSIFSKNHIERPVKSMSRPTSKRGRKVSCLTILLICAGIIAVTLYVGISWYQACGYPGAVVNHQHDPSGIVINATNIQQLTMLQSVVGDMRVIVKFTRDDNRIVANGRPKPEENYSGLTPTSCVTFWLWDAPKPDQANSNLSIWNRGRPTNHFVDTFSYLISPDSQVLVTDERSVIDIVTGTKLGSLGNSREGLFQAIAFSPDGQRIAATAQSSIMLWDAASLELINSIPTDQSFNHLLFDADNRLISAGWDNNAIYFWDIDNGELISSFPIPMRDMSSISDIELSPDRNLLLIAVNAIDNAIIFNITDEKFIQLSEAGVDGQFSSDGTLLLMYTRLDARVLEVATDTKLAEFTYVNQGFEFISVAFSSENGLVAIGRVNGEVQFWSTDGVLLHTIQTNAGWVSSLDFNSTGTLLAVATRNEDTGKGEVQVYGINSAS